MLEERKRASLPDISYDLNGDGIVTSKEYFLAQLFDKDKDGKLNAQEKANALNALKHGFENNFVWNIDKSVSQRSIRIMQMRGAIVEADDISKVKDTYP